MAGDTIKVRIEFEGIQEYRNSIRAANDSVSLLKSQLRLLDASNKGAENSTKVLAEKKAILAKQTAQAKAKVEEQTKALEKIKAKYGESSHETMQSEGKLNAFKVALVEVEGQLNETSEALTRSKYGFASFGEFANKAGGTLWSIGKFGAKAFIGGTKMLTGVAIGAATALTGMAISAGKLADDLLTQSSVTRISTDDLQKFKYSLNFIDGDINVLTGAMTKNIKNMEAAATGNKSLRKTYKDLGVSVKDSKGELRDSNDVFWDTIGALGKVENPTKREALAMKLLGKSAKELNPIIEAGSKKFKEMGLEAEAMGLIIGNDSLGKLGEFDDTMNKLKLTGEGIKNTFAIMALPFLQEIADGGLDLLVNFNKAMQESGGDATKMQLAVNDLIGGIVSFSTDKLPEFITMGGSILGAIIEGLGQNSDGIGTAIQTFIATVKDAIQKHGGEILKSDLAGVLSGIFGGDYNDLKEEITKIENAIKDGFSNARASVEKIWNGLGDLLAGPFNIMKDAIGSAINWLRDLLGLSGKKVEVEFVEKHTTVRGTTHAGGSTTFGHAEGGVFRKPTFFPAANAVVGEAGVEAVIPIRKLFDWMDARYRGREKESGNVYVTQNIYAESTDYYAQQKQAARQLELLLGNL